MCGGGGLCGDKFIFSGRLIEASRSIILNSSKCYKSNINCDNCIMCIDFSNDKVILSTTGECCRVILEVFAFSKQKVVVVN